MLVTGCATNRPYEYYRRHRLEYRLSSLSTGYYEGQIPAVALSPDAWLYIARMMHYFARHGIAFTAQQMMAASD